MKETGNISIHTENIFPIIKKFLYSDHEIFLRELVSNAVDASQKIKRLSSIGEFNGELRELKVKVSFDKDKKTITISDNGIGMTAEEIKKYINQIAFSGATRRAPPRATRSACVSRFRAACASGDRAPGKENAPRLELGLIAGTRIRNPFRLVWHCPALIARSCGP